MNIISKIKEFIKNNRTEFLILAAILVVGAFFRLYKIESYMTFLGDEGRDVIIVRRLLTEAHPPLIGPGTSIGNMYLGPFYYYMMAPALLLANFSPVGPAVQIALLGIITIWFIWYVFRKWFPVSKINWGALVAAGLYAISPTVIIYSRSSWNPNIMPFFALLAIYSIWVVYKEHKFNWLIVLGFAFGACLESHYLGLLLVPTLGIFWLLTLRDLKVNKLDLKSFVQKSVLGLSLFVLMLSPLFFFDIRHDWVNTRAMYTFFTVRQTTVSIKPWTALPNMYPQYSLVLTRLVGGQNILAGKILSLVMLGIIVWLGWFYLKNKKSVEPFSNLVILLTWLGFGILGLGLYKQHIYDHYYGFIFAAPFLIIGVMVNYLLKYKILGKILGSVLVIYLIIINLNNSPLKSTPNNQLKRAYDVAQKIEKESGGNRFNLGVIAEQNYEGGYKYFLLKDNQPVIDIDSQTKNSITDQLFVVCEFYPVSKCDPTHNPNAAVANFGWSKVTAQWDIDGAILYKLVHTQK